MLDPLLDITIHLKPTSKNIQQVKETDPKRPDAASRGVKSTDSSPDIIVASDIGWLYLVCRRLSRIVRRAGFATAAKLSDSDRFPGEFRCAVEDSQET